VRLEPISLRNPVPLDVQPPVLTAATPTGLHLFARESTGGRTGRCMVNAQAASGGAGHLSLSMVSGAAPCNGVLVVAGASVGRAPVIMGLSDAGDERWSADVDPKGELGAWPIPVCARGRVALVWWTKPATLHVAQVEGRTARAAGSLDCGDAIDGLEAATSDDTVAAVVATARALVLVTFADGAVTNRVPVAAGRTAAPGICALGGGLLVTWMTASNKELRLRRFAGPTAQVEPDQAIVRADQGESLRSLRLLGAYRDQVALTWTLSQGGRRGDLTMQQFAAVYDATTGTLGPAQDLGPGGIFVAGGWIGDALVVIHGADAPLASAFRLIA
jgi:hypothetical protein